MYMMRTIYLLIAFAGLCMASCQEVTIGYLKTEHAKYSIDTLYVGERSILEQIEAMELQYPPELKEMALAYRELKVLEEEMDGMYAESNALEEELTRSEWMRYIPGWMRLMNGSITMMIWMVFMVMAWTCFGMKDSIMSIRYVMSISG